MKKKVALLFGSASKEKDVSFWTAISVFEHINKEKYDVLAIAFDNDNNSYLVENMLELKKYNSIEKIFSNLKKIDLFRALEDIDVVFPLMHGTYGEDGSIQGLLKFLKKDCVGCGILASSICMDKRMAKICFKNAGIKVVEDVNIVINEFKNELIFKEKLESIKKLNFPVFVKPANMGSSVGISKVKNESELKEAIYNAFLYDEAVIVEKAIDAREIECAVIGNYELDAIEIGEIIPSKEFYDYEAKYSDNCVSNIIIPANIDENMINIIKDLSIKAFKSVFAKGFARVDFLVDKNTNEIYLNEINTIPGFTKYSMFPRLCNAKGIEYSQLIDKLIGLAKNE